MKINRFYFKLLKNSFKIPKRVNLKKKKGRVCKKLNLNKQKAQPLMRNVQPGKET